MLCNFSQVLNGNFLGVRSGTPKPVLPLQKRGLQCGWSESYSLTEMSSRQIGGSKIILSFFLPILCLSSLSQNSILQQLNKCQF